HKVHFFKSKLQPKAAPLDCKKRWSRPASVALAAHYNSFSVSAPDTNASLGHAGHYRDTFSFIQQVCRNALVRRAHYFIEDVGCSPKSFGLLRAISAPGGSCNRGNTTQDKNGKRDHMLH